MSGSSSTISTRLPMPRSARQAFPDRSARLRLRLARPRSARQALPDSLGSPPAAPRTAILPAARLSNLEDPGAVGADPPVSRLREHAPRRLVQRLVAEVEGPPVNRQQHPAA